MCVYVYVCACVCMVVKSGRREGLSYKEWGGGKKTVLVGMGRRIGLSYREGKGEGWNGL